MRLEDVVLLTTHGTLDKPRLPEKETSLVKNFRGKKVVITGWDFASKGRVIAENYDLDAIVTEGCILYLKDVNRGWGQDAKLTKFKLFQDTDLNLVKKINNVITYTLQTYTRELVVFRSQGNEYGVCYYINPPDSIVENLKSYTPEEIGIRDFKYKLESKFKVKTEETKGKLKILDTPDNRYFVEKINGLYRTFRSYSLSFHDEGHQYILVDLNPAEPMQKFTFEDVQRIAKQPFIADNLSFDEYMRIAPQADVCIDIFCQPKVRTWQKGLEKAGISKDSPIYYVSKGTEADVLLILDGYARGNFFAFGSNDMPERLKEIKVMPIGETTAEVFEKLIYLIISKYR